MPSNCELHIEAQLHNITHTETTPNQSQGKNMDKPIMKGDKYTINKTLTTEVIPAL